MEQETIQEQPAQEQPSKLEQLYSYLKLLKSQGISESDRRYQNILKEIAELEGTSQSQETEEKEETQETEEETEESKEEQEKLDSADGNNDGWYKKAGKWVKVQAKKTIDTKHKKTAKAASKLDGKIFKGDKFRKAVGGSQGSEQLVQGAGEQRRALEASESQVVGEDLGDEEQRVGTQGTFDTRAFKPQEPVYKYGFNQSKVAPNAKLFNAKLFSSRRSNLQGPYSDNPMAGSDKFTTMMGKRHKETPRQMPIVNVAAFDKREPTRSPRVGSFSNPMLSLMQKPNVRFRNKQNKFPDL